MIDRAKKAPERIVFSEGYSTQNMRTAPRSWADPDGYEKIGARAASPE
jgi:hypothetical protein